MIAMVFTSNAFPIMIELRHARMANIALTLMASTNFSEWHEQNRKQSAGRHNGTLALSCDNDQ